MRLTHGKLPVARDEGLLVEHVGDEIVVYDGETKEAHCLSPLAATVFAHCDGRTDLDGLARVASEELGEPISPSRVDDALAQLGECDLMEPRAPRQVGVSRREMIRRTAAVGGGVASLSLITTVMAPIAHAGASATCGTKGSQLSVLCCPCGTGGQDAGKQGCCTIEGVTENCVCVSAQGNSSKFCKPGQNSAVQDADCLAPNGSLTNTCAICAANSTPVNNCACERIPGTNCVGPNSCNAATCPNGVVCH